MIIYSCLKVIARNEVTKQSSFDVVVAKKV